MTAKHIPLVPPNPDPMRQLARRDALNELRQSVWASIQTTVHEYDMAADVQEIGPRLRRLEAKYLALTQLVATLDHELEQSCGLAWMYPWAEKTSNILFDGRPLQVPPVSAEFLVYLFVPEAKRKRFIQHFEEEFAVAVDRLGLRRARIWYWVEVFRAIGPIVGARMKKPLAHFVDLVMKAFFKRLAASVDHRPSKE